MTLKMEPKLTILQVFLKNPTNNTTLAKKNVYFCGNLIIQAFNPKNTFWAQALSDLVKVYINKKSYAAGKVFEVILKEC